MQKIEQTLDSQEVAEMIGKAHKDLLRDIRRYNKQMTESKIAPSDFFRESDYKDSTGRTLPCYRITKKGCEFIAHKLTGVKGTIFTARYINRFHEMQDIIADKAAVQEPVIPWFVRRFRGRYIVLERDFISITGVDIKKHKAFYREEYFTSGLDWNGYAWHTTVNREKFKRENGFDYGENECMIYLYPCGVRKALRILSGDKKVKLKEGAYELLTEGLSAIQPPKKNETALQKKQTALITDNDGGNIPIQINLVVEIPKLNI